MKCYHHESGSDRVDALLSQQGDRYFISRLALVELHSTFARLVREQVLPAADFHKLVARLYGDVGARLLLVAALSNQRMEGACSLLRTNGFVHNMRTLDAIHLATAQALHARNRLAAFVAADKKLLSAAAACGLATIDVG